jgi:cbb3-type cytochrome oxidase maturation protein
MSVIFLLIPLSVIIAASFLGAFIWAVRSGQYEDTCTPSMRLLAEEAGTRVERESCPDSQSQPPERQSEPKTAEVQSQTISAKPGDS